MKPLRCLLWLHDWHETQVWNRGVLVPLYRGLMKDRICVRCGHRDLRAGRELARRKDRMHRVRDAIAKHESPDG